MAGILDGLFKGVLPDTIKPQVIGNDIKLVITEADFITMATKGIDPQVQRATTIKITEGKIEITVRLV